MIKLIEVIKCQYIILELWKDCYFHTLKTKRKGLAYCGITLIPPESMERFREILLMKDRIEYTELISLLDKGIKENRYIIHFGI